VLFAWDVLSNRFDSFIRSLQRVDGVSENMHVGLDLVREVGQLLLFVKDLDPLGVGVVNHYVGTLHSGSKVADLLRRIMLELVSSFESTSFGLKSGPFLWHL